MHTDNKVKGKKIVIVTHEYATGPSHALEAYLNSKVSSLFFIAHPFVFAKDIRSHYRFDNFISKFHEEKKFINFGRNQIISVLKDILVTFFWIVSKGRFDIYIGIDGVNALVGIILKKIGLIKQVVYYTIDYVPVRFDNAFLNYIYHSIDKIALQESDIVWNLSSIMVSEREKNGVDKRYREKQIVVPVGTESNVKKISFNKIKRYHIVHMGHLIKKQGVQLVVEAIPGILKKVPKFHLDIVGGGEYENFIKDLAHKLGVLKYITFYGFVKDHNEVEKIMSYCALGVAPYVDSKDNYVRYTDPGKVKAYAAAGLPIIITNVPEIAKLIARKKCGLMISYNVNELTRAIIKLLTDDKLLQQFRKNVQKFAKDYNWEKVFSLALSKTIT